MRGQHQAAADRDLARWQLDGAEPIQLGLDVFLEDGGGRGGSGSAGERNGESETRRGAEEATALHA